MKKYRFGKPIKTDSIVVDHALSNAPIAHCKLVLNDGFKLTHTMGKNDLIYGLGENLRGINKRGGIYESFCSDDPNHTPDKKALYGAHNFIIVDGDVKFGIFIDYPGKIGFDIGFTDKDLIEITIENNDLDLYIFEGETPMDIIKKFRSAIGKSYAPPKWAFGFQQSRWSYPDKANIENIADQFIKNDIPCDAIYLDIDYMEKFKNFTIDENRFPDFEEFVASMKDKGFRLIPIIDAGCKIEESYDVCDEGVSKGYYCVDAQGKPFVGAVWPGKVYFPDFLNPEARKWFGNKYKRLIDQGIEGFWNDMNEPAIFYSERGLTLAIDKAIEAKGQNMGVYPFFDLRNAFTQLSNNDDDYKSFYHNMNGQLVNHYDVHNLYGYNMIRAAAESFDDSYPNKRFLLFSRASCVGMHRYGGIWTGDNHSWWEHLLVNIKMMPSLNMCGFLYSGADVGGFSGDANSELVIRWTQFGIFTPLLRNHAVAGSRSQEPFAFEGETTAILRKTIQFRYSMLPYIYSEFMKSVHNDDLYLKPLAFEYDDQMSKRTEDQLLVGESLMIAPIYAANVLGRHVWLPEEMLLWKVSDYKNVDCEVLKQGHQYINIELDEVPVFVRKNKIFVVGNHSKNVDTINNETIEVIAFVDDHACYILYDDDGSSNDYQQGKCNELLIDVVRKGDGFEFNITNKGNTEIKQVNYTIVDMDGKTEKGVQLV